MKNGLSNALRNSSRIATTSTQTAKFSSSPLTARRSGNSGTGQNFQDPQEINAIRTFLDIFRNTGRSTPESGKLTETTQLHLSQNQLDYLTDLPKKLGLKQVSVSAQDNKLFVNFPIYGQSLRDLINTCESHLPVELKYSKPTKFGSACHGIYPSSIACPEWADAIRQENVEKAKAKTEKDLEDRIKARALADEAITRDAHKLDAQLQKTQTEREEKNARLQKTFAEKNSARIKSGNTLAF